MMNIKVDIFETSFVFLEPNNVYSYIGYSFAGELAWLVSA